MNQSRRRSNRKKAVPLYFQKSHSNSQFLAAANYKLQIKKLKKTNKELARSLQDAKCRAADQERALAKCNQESTQALYVKMKIKDIVETVQKLVTDLGNVYDVIDGKSFDFLKNSSATHQAIRLQICNPGLSLVEESASMSTIEPDLSKEENLCAENLARPAEAEAGSTTPSFFDADSSQTEIYNIPLLLAPKPKSVSNGNQSAAGRSSKSLEHGSSSPLDLDCTPEPPSFQWPFKRQSSVDASKRGSITSQTPVKPAELPQMQPVTSTSAVKSASKSTISKIPVRKPAVATEKNSPRLAVSSIDKVRRKTFVVEKVVEDTQEPLPTNKQTDKIVLNSLPDNGASSTIFDRRGTFVVDSLTDDTKQDTVFDRRFTYFIPGSKEQPETRPEAILDRRGTYFVPAEPKEQPKAIPDTVDDQTGTSFIPAEPMEHTYLPKVIETHNPVQNVVPNETIYLCEDMELTEILPPQKQQSPLIIPPWNEKLEAKKPALDENLSASDTNQPSCTTSLFEQFPISNNNIKPTEVVAVHEDEKAAQIQTTVNDNKFAAPNKSPEASVSNQDLNPTDPHQDRDKGKNVEKKALKKDDTNVKHSAKELPSPITHYTNHDMSIQHKIFESFSAIDTISNKNKPTFDSTSVVKRDDPKELTASTDSLSTNKPAVEQIAVKEDAKSPVVVRKSGRNQKKMSVYFDTSSEESNLDIDIDFVPPKRPSIKPGRRIINPNNKKVFVFKTTSKKQSGTKDTLTDSSPNEPKEEENIKNEPENDVFNFSSSSDATKSPVTKNKKRKSLMPKGNKRSVSKQSEGKKLSKTRSSKPEVNNDEVSVSALSRKSILSMKKADSPLHLKQLSRKSVRFSIVGAVASDKINIPKCDSPSEENITLVNQESDNIIDAKTMSSGSTPGSQDKGLSSKKKYSLARASSLKATGDILKSSSGKAKRSRKRQTTNLNSDSPENVCESECSPKKKVCKASVETPATSTEMDSNLSQKKQEQKKDVKDRFEPSQGVSPTTTSEVAVKNRTGKETEKIPTPPNQCENVKITTSKDEATKTETKVKRPFSGVSERRSNKKQSLAEDLFDSEVPDEKLSDSKKGKKSSRTRPKLSQNLESNAKIIGSVDEAEGTENKVKRPFSGVSERRSNKKQSIVDDLFPSEVHEKPSDGKKGKHSTRILSELSQNSDVDVKIIGSVDEIEETNIYKAKRPYSEVSEHTSNKKKLVVDDQLPSLDDAICEMNDLKTSFKLAEEEPTEIYNVKALTKSAEAHCDKDTLVNTKKVEKNKGSLKKRSYNKKKTSKQSSSKENIPNQALKNIKLDVLSDYNLEALPDEYVAKLVKPKNSRKKKESVPLLQNDLKIDALSSENATESEEVGGRSRRRKEVNYALPKINCKMRRE